MPMNMFPVGGMTIRIACGSTTLMKAWARPMPTDRAAWRCPSGTAWIPLRKISPSQAEYWIVKVTMPAWMAVIRRSNWIATP